MILMNPVLLLCRRPITTGENYLQYLMIPVWEIGWFCGVRIRGPESIEWFIEGKAFSRSYDSAPRPPPLPSVSSTGDTQKYLERETTCWRERGGEGDGRVADSYGRKKARSSINHWILSAGDPLRILFIPIHCLKKTRKFPIYRDCSAMQVLKNLTFLCPAVIFKEIISNSVKRESLIS
jgi:hypothetical protein